MNDTALHSTLREWRAVMTQPSTLCIMGVIAVVLTVVAPFDTDALLRVVPRFGYWLTMIVATYSAGFWVNTLLEKSAVRHLRQVVRIMIGGTTTGLVVAVIVLVINGLTIGYWPSMGVLPLFLINIFIIAFGIAVVFEVLSAQADNTADPAKAPAILDRLPFDKRGPLIALSVEDHYVSVQTTKGREMVLMRLSDAIREVSPTQGLQVHRSHWVALSAVTQATRKGDGALLTLSNAAEVPVSRANMAAIRDAGLLPKAQGQSNG